MAWLDENASDSNRSGALAALSDSWAQLDPEAAAAWAMEVGTGDPGRDDKVLERVFRRWMEDDLASAAGYLAQQEPSPELDGALEQYIQRIRKFDPDATMAWPNRSAIPGAAVTPSSTSPRPGADRTRRPSPPTSPAHPTSLRRSETNC